MNLVTVIPILLTVLLAAGLYRLVRRIAAPHAQLPVTPGWIEELSTERYRPMQRLLDQSDLEFLRTQPGFNRQMAVRIRKQRCQIFRGYLRCLNNDFTRVCLALKLIMLQAGNDRPDLAALLLRRQVQFATGIAYAQLRIFLYRWGICGVDVSPLVRTFDGMRLQLQSLVPVALGLEA
jgi:hypothetical protein